MQRFRIQPSKAHIAMSETDTVDFKYGSIFEFGKALATHIDLQNGTHLQAALMPNPQHMRYGESDQLIDRLLVHVVNFPPFLGSGSQEHLRCQTPTGGSTLLGRAVLSDPP